MEFQIKAGPQGHYYFPKSIRQALGEELKILSDKKCVLIYPVDAGLREVLKSLEVLTLELKLLAGELKE